MIEKFRPEFEAHIEAARERSLSAIAEPEPAPVLVQQGAL
jgi:hypothetical protein